MLTDELSYLMQISICGRGGEEKATPKVKIRQWSDTKFQNFNHCYFWYSFFTANEYINGPPLKQMDKKFFWFESLRSLHSVTDKFKMENYFIQRDLSKCGLAKGQTQIISTQKWGYHSSPEHERPGCSNTAVTWHRTVLSGPSSRLDSLTPLSSEPPPSSLPFLPHPHPRQPSSHQLPQPPLHPASVLAYSTRRRLPWPHSPSPHPSPRFSGPTWTPCRTSLQLGGPVSRAEDEEVVAGASGYCRARGSRGRAEPERRREGGGGCQAGEAVGRRDRWGGRKFFRSHRAQPSRFSPAEKKLERLHFRFTPS